MLRPCLRIGFLFIGYFVALAVIAETGEAEDHPRPTPLVDKMAFCQHVTWKNRFDGQTSYLVHGCPDGSEYWVSWVEPKHK